MRVSYLRWICQIVGGDCLLKESYVLSGASCARLSGGDAQGSRINDGVNSYNGGSGIDSLRTLLLRVWEKDKASGMGSGVVRGGPCARGGGVGRKHHFFWFCRMWV